MHIDLFRKHNAFTMVELIFVIVVLSIVASIGSQIIAKTYESYIVERGLYRSTSKTELAINQIANRLRYSIPGTVVARQNTTGAIVPVGEITDNNYTVLQWVSSDVDSYEAIDSDSNLRPGWSGVCDINRTTTSNLKTPGSDLNLSSEIIDNLGGDLNGSYVYFPDGNYTEVKSGSSDEDIKVDLTGYTIWERYKLAWSSYALSIEDGTVAGTKDLYLYYNFTPRIGADLGTTKKLILKNVTNLRFMGNSKSVHIKICKAEQIGTDSNDTVHTCKEKVIF